MPPRSNSRHSDFVSAGIGRTESVGDFIHLPQPRRQEVGQRPAIGRDREATERPDWRGDASRGENRQSEADREQYAAGREDLRRHPECRASQFRFGHADRNGPPGLSRMAEDSQQGNAFQRSGLNDALPLCLQMLNKGGRRLSARHSPHRAREKSPRRGGRLQPLTSLAASTVAARSRRTRRERGFQRQHIGDLSVLVGHRVHRSPLQRVGPRLPLEKVGNCWAASSEYLPCVLHIFTNRQWCSRRQSVFITCWPFSRSNRMFAPGNWSARTSSARRRNSAKSPVSNAREDVSARRAAIYDCNSCSTTCDILRASARVCWPVTVTSFR